MFSYSRDGIKIMAGVEVIITRIHNKPESNSYLFLSLHKLEFVLYKLRIPSFPLPYTQ